MKTWDSILASDSPAQKASSRHTLLQARPGEFVSSTVKTRWDPDPQNPLLARSPLELWDSAMAKSSPLPLQSVCDRLSSLENMG